MRIKKERPLSEKHKIFVRAIVCNGMGQGAAYKKAFGNVKSPDSKASNLLKRASIIKYKEKISRRMENKVVEKSLWDREIATHHLLWLLGVAKKEIETSGLTKPTVLGLINSAKELDRIYGLNKPPANFSNIPRVIIGSDCDMYGFNLKNIPATLGNHDNRQILRNCVDPEIGKYIFENIIGN